MDLLRAIGGLQNGPQHRPAAPDVEEARQMARATTRRASRLVTRRADA